MAEQRVELETLTVQVEHDEVSGIWYVAASDLPGLAAEAESYDALVAIIQDVAPDLLRANLPRAALDRTRLTLRHTLSPQSRPAA
jgi:hypothetical protein